MKSYNLRKENCFFRHNKRICQVKTYNGLGSETVFIGTGQNDAGLLTVNNNLGLAKSIVGDEIGRGKVETTNDY